MPCLLEWSDESLKAWSNVLVAAAKPARYPHFPQLDQDGSWKDWSPSPNLPDHEPTFVEQPPQSRRAYPGDKSAIEHELHQPLHYGTLTHDHIRLLKIDHAMMDDDVLRGFELVTVPLETAPEYEALSYCWRDMRLCTGIFFPGCDGSQRVLRITEDLATFLYVIIRSQVRPRYLWIDQISINQQDTNERNTQVRFMGNIYQNASQVLVWLGQQSDFQPERQSLPMNPEPHTDVGGISVLQWIMSSAIFARPWFSRLWVFQEVVQAKLIKVFVGDSPRTWQSLDDLARWLWDSKESSDMALIYAYINPVFLYHVQKAKEEIATQGQMNLARWLPQINGRLKCRDARDKVFALLGCAKDMFPVDFVDYRKTNTDVFTDFARILIERTESLSIIAYFNPERNCNVPTWVTQWDQFYKLSLEGIDREYPYSASRGRAHITVPSTNAQRLTVQGKVVDIIEVDMNLLRCNYPTHTIVVLYSNLISMLDQVWPKMRHVYHSPIQPIDCCSVTDYYCPNFVRDAVDALLCHDGHSLDKIYSVIESLLFLIRDGYSPSGLSGDIIVVSSSQFMREIAKSVGRRLVILQSSRMAMVRGVAQVGDPIVILHGLNTPCVLHKTEEKGEWQFCGDTFVKGIMQGEGVSWEEDQADTFVL
ncbi:HET-domain-containing protein, partial [Dothidotthia symphoricarpi CBS 119687]